MNIETSVDFLNNIELSRKLISSKGRKTSDYWLNVDGTIASKTTWLARAIRWIQDLLFNKTISDTWSIFQKTIEVLEKKRSSLEETEKKALRFVAKFFHDLKPELNHWLKTDEKRIEFLESRLLTECGDSIEDALVTVYTQSRFVSLETIKRVPSEKKIDSIVGDIAELKSVYDKIPLEKESIKTLVEKTTDSSFWNILLESAKSFSKTDEIIEKKSLEKCSWPKLSYEEMFGQKQLSDFFSGVKHILRECLEKKEDDGFPMEVYLNMILNKTLYKLDTTLDANGSFLQLYKDSKQRDLFHSFIDSVKNRNPKVPGATESNFEEYYSQIEFYLRKILKAVPPKRKLTKIMTKNFESKIKRKDIYKALKELADASELCFAAWVWECGEQCRILKIDCPENESFQEIEQHLLHESHHLKESLIIESIRDDNAVHYLNGFKCSEEGKSLGFSDKFAAKDPYRAELNAKQKTLLKDYVIAEYPKGLLKHVNKSFSQFGLQSPPTFPKSMQFLEKQQVLLF